MELNIKVDKKHCRSNAISNGKNISEFFESLTRNVFEKSYDYWKSYNEIIPDNNDLPLIYSERNLYSMFAAAIDKITPIHLSEYSFNRSEHEKLTANRRVDIWCLNKNDEINYFIEIKKGYYCLNENTSPDFPQSVTGNINSLIAQIREIKKIKPDWGTDNVFLGLYVIHGYYREGKEYYDHGQIIENIYNQIDKRLKFQLIFSTWTLEEEMNIAWGNGDKCKFISIAGIVMTE